MKQQFQILLWIGVVGFFLTACDGGKTETANIRPEPVNIEIEMTEYQFSPGTLELSVGQETTLTLVNKGALEHELMIGRQMQMTDNKPAGYHVDMFEQAGIEPEVVQAEHTVNDEADMQENAHGNDTHGGHTGFMVNVPQGDSEATVTFTVTETMVGEWEMGCFLLEGVHYKAGMKGKLVVKSG